MQIMHFSESSEYSLLQKRGLQATILGTICALLITVIAPVSAMALENQTPATDNNTSVSSGEIANALRGVDGVLSQSDQTPTSSDADSAIKAASAGAQIDIPKDASKGVTLDSANAPALNITLPNATSAGDARKIAAGAVAYSGNDGSANAVQATEDGGVRMLTIIDNPNAPTTYDYGVSVPDGGRIEITADGGASVYDGTNNVIAIVGAPWAKDANGKIINTYFTTDGITLTQHVEHNVPGVVYPVTADPIWFAVSGAVFWWAVQRCGAGAIIGSVFDYAAGSRSPRSIAAAGAANCVASFIGGWKVLKGLVSVRKFLLH